MRIVTRFRAVDATIVTFAIKILPAGWCAPGGCAGNPDLDHARQQRLGKYYQSAIWRPLDRQVSE